VSFLVFTWRGRSRPASASVAGLALVLLAAPSFAQQSGDPVAARLSRLEEKVKELQVMVGTMESFARTKPGVTLSQEAPPPVPQVLAPEANLGPRIDALETQITALTSHLERIGKQMSALEAKLSALEAAPPPTPIAPPAEAPAMRQGTAPLEPGDGSTAALGAVGGDNDGENYDSPKPRWYGPKPGSNDLAALLESQAAESQAGRPQNLTPALPGGDAQSLYQQGYGALLQKDYANAEGAFRHLLDTYPSDPLAGDAQYWIGETYYVRGQYKNAADAFLSGYKRYKSSQKAPDSLLKLGMSLAELGQKDAACSTFAELKTKFPQAPEHVSDEAKAWRKKTGC